MPTTPDETARGRPGLVPHPPNHPSMPRPGTPDAPIPALPRTQPPKKGAPKRSAAETDMWAYTFEGEPGEELQAVDFTPPIDLRAPQPLLVQFYADTPSRPPSTIIPQPDQETAVSDSNYDDPQVIADPGDDTFRVVSTGGSSVAILLGTETGGYGPIEAQAALATAARVRIWCQVADMPPESPGGTNRSYIYNLFNVDTTNPQYVRINGELLSESHPGNPLIDGQTHTIFLLTPTDPIELRPNAIVRARLTYSAGKASEISFDCDWSGALQLFADRLSLSRVAFAADAERPYHPHSVKVRAVVVAKALAPRLLPTLTEPTRLLAEGQTEQYEAPPLARRVSLLALYGDEGAPGDAPLGQLFVAFVASTDNAIAYIDAMSAREALFGAGLPIPAGTRTVALTNRSTDDSVRLGVIWHLGV